MQKKNYRSNAVVVGSIVALGCSALVRTSTAAITPISLAASTFDYNIVAGSGNGTPQAVTASMDGGVYSQSGSTLPNDTYYLKGFNTGASGTGIPLGTTITSDANANTTFALQSATATNNVLGLSQQGSQSAAPYKGTMTLSTPTAYSELAFLGVFNNPGTVTYSINFLDGASSQTGTISFPGWFSYGPTAAFSADGRVQIQGTNNPNGSVVTGYGGFDQVGNTQGDLLFETDLAVTDTTDLISNISFSIGGGGSNAERSTDAIFALSGTPVPEPTSIVGLAVCGGSLLMRRRRVQPCA